MAFLEPSNAETLRRFLFLLETLDPIRGPRAQSFTGGTDARVDQNSIRRSFVDAIAYVCAYQRGPHHVIAAALQQESNGITLWLAGNEAVDEKVKIFLDKLLNKLRETVRLLDRDMDVAQAEPLSANELLRDIISFQEPRIRVYYRLAKSGLESFENFNTTHLSALREWLNERFPDGECLFPEGTQLEALVRDCHDLRHSGHSDTFHLLIQQEHGGCHDFQLLHKLLGKIGKHIAVAQALVRAAVRFPELARKFQISVVPFKSEKGGPTPSSLPLESILKYVFSLELDRKRFLERFKFLNGSDGVPGILEKKDEAKTYVHAELILLDHLARGNYEFMEGDKYIGCSKPACYLCHAYIENHPGRFAVPSCHNKIYLNWRTPDIDPQNSSSLEMTEKVIESLIVKVKKDLYAEMGSTEPRRPFHPDSPA